MSHAIKKETFKEYNSNKTEYGPSQNTAQTEYFRMSNLASGGETEVPPSMNYHRTSDQLLLVGGPSKNMARKGVCLIIKMVLSHIGVIAGISIFVSFFFHYHNYHAGTWGFLSGVFAGGVLQLYILHYRDSIENWHSTTTLKHLMIFGFLMFIISTACFVLYIVLAITKQQTYTLYNFSYYPAATFSFMSIKWSVMLAWESRSLGKHLAAANPPLITGIPSELEARHSSVHA